MAMFIIGDQTNCNRGAALRNWLVSCGLAVAGVLLLCLAVHTLAGRARSREPMLLKEFADSAAEHAVRTQFGKELFMQNCSSCHNTDATGMPRQGANLRDSVFIARRTDAQLVSFLRVGRMPGDRDTVLGLTMPPRGGNAALEDDELADIVAYLRLVKRARDQSAHAGSAGAARTLAAR